MRAAFPLGGLSDVTVFDRSQGVELPVYHQGGRYYVEGQPGNEYEIRLRNQGEGDLLAVVSVDGVNVITGQTASHAQPGYVLEDYQPVHVAGWRKRLSKIARFFFTRLQDSYAARTGRPDHVGVIGVALFQRRVPVQVEPPLSRMPMESSSGAAAVPERRAEEKADDRLGTGHGRIEGSHARYTSFERASDRPAEVIAIYYDSRANLIARGILPEERHGAHSRDPDPFPNTFVPDPPAHVR
ncbi:MAG: hypothetical protein EXR36_02510 [Betaproteobacteria bacterium]|nr:hypothetical protein [Betaproteobacteria bacterium]